MKGSMEDLEPNKPTVIKLVSLADEQTSADQTLPQRKISLKYPSKETYKSRSIKQLHQLDQTSTEQRSPVSQTRLKMNTTPPPDQQPNPDASVRNKQVASLSRVSSAEM